MPYKTVFKINSREGKFGCESYDNNICQSILLSITSGIKLHFPDDNQKHNINNNNNNNNNNNKGKSAPLQARGAQRVPGS